MPESKAEKSWKEEQFEMRFYSQLSLLNWSLSQGWLLMKGPLLLAS